MEISGTTIEIKQTSTPKPIAKRMWHILRAVYYMLYKGISKHKHFTVFNLRLLSCRFMDSPKSFHAPREVEFSCSNTPVFFPDVRKKRRYHYENAKAVARAFEILNAEYHLGTDSYLFSATPSPAAAEQARQLRVTDSPFLTREEEGEVGRHVDKEAEDFIRRFYQQLRSQQEPLIGLA